MEPQLLSLLSGEEIKSLELVKDSADENLYRASTYDLSVGEIIPAGSASGGSAYNLPPGGTVRVVSKELLKLPNSITGHALLKNELCRKGVLAINIGVIDPGFEGPISSILINFGQGNFVVKQGDAFLRISFHRCPPSSKADKSVKYNRQQYISLAKAEVDAYMAPTFLNIDVTAKRAARRAFGSFKKALTLWAIVAGILLALIAILAPLGASYVDKYVVTGEQHELQLEQTVEAKVEGRYDARLKTLTDQVEELKRTTADKSGRGSASAKP
jgi:dUTPase